MLGDAMSRYRSLRRRPAIRARAVIARIFRLAPIVILPLGTLFASSAALAQPTYLETQQAQQAQQQQQQQQQQGQQSPPVPAVQPLPADPMGALRLRQATEDQASQQTDGRQLLPSLTEPDGRLRVPLSPMDRYIPGEFERFVQKLAGPIEPPGPSGLRREPVRRFGAELVTGTFDGRATDLSPAVPADYIIAPGDEVLLTLWGSVDADLRLIVDRAGRVSVPRVGAIQVGGVRSADLAAVVQQRVAKVFKNFQLSVSLGQLRGVRVFVTGFVVRPGSYTVDALSTVVGALMRAGGPSAAGSFRHIELKRKGTLVAQFDLYDLLLQGDRSADRIVQAGDVVHVGAVGPQVGVIGSVNRATIVEIAPNETVGDVLGMAGGFSAVADRTRIAVERLQQRYEQRVTELQLPRDASLTLSHGDVLTAFSAAEAVLSIQNQNKRVRVDGEVARPGEYVLTPGQTLADALRAAGGLTPVAFLYGTQFTRESVRETQQENYDRALRDLETDFARASGTQRVSSSDQATSLEAQQTATARLIQRLRALKPSGRVVLQMEPDSTALPDLVLEDGDRLYVPPLPTTVGVCGSVFNSGSYLYGDKRELKDYLRLAGGPTKGADEDSMFVIRANGQVISGRQSGGGWFGGGSIESTNAQPGDTVFVPEEMDKTTFVQAAKDWTQILYQFGLGIAGIKSAVK